MSIDPLVLALTAYAHNFFVISTQDARRLAVLAVELSNPEDDEADLIDLVNLLWRANRDAQMIEESDRHIPVCLVMDVDAMPSAFVLQAQEPKEPKYAKYFHAQPADQPEYRAFMPPWLPPQPEPLPAHFEQHHHISPAPEDRKQRVERDLRTSFGE